MTWAWLTLCPDPPVGAFASAAAFDTDGAAAGYVAAWRPDGVHPEGAGKIDGRAVDPGPTKPSWGHVHPPPYGRPGSGIVFLYTALRPLRAWGR